MLGGLEELYGIGRSATIQFVDHHDERRVVVRSGDRFGDLTEPVAECLERGLRLLVGRGDLFAWRRKVAAHFVNQLRAGMGYGRKRDSKASPR